ncbi:hypothetical protein [Fodinicola acaciae]|uniref:hypothetical protein n=1 Tax=Fodinicola acaciae TaxID=2681555 RepID=UPI0013D5D72D|nr:hypothetical protein [Fodinicola acaciae]
MTVRGRFLLYATSWAVVVAIAQAAIPLSVRDRLPEPMATHWSLLGEPNRAMPLAGELALMAGAWVVIAGLLALGAVRGRIERRRRRATVSAVYGAAGVLSVGLAYVTTTANLDVTDWRHAQPLAWPAMAAVLVIAVAAGFAGYRLGRLGPDTPADLATAHPKAMRLDANVRAAWVSSATNPLLGVPGSVALGLAVVFAVAAAIGAAGLTWHAPLVAAVIGLALTACSSLRVRVNDSGLAVGFGPFGWPVRHIGLDRIDRAWSEPRQPVEVGGWGWRGLPGGSTIMIRGGDCLVVRYRSGGELGISVDDAERGAALLTALANRTHAS